MRALAVLAISVVALGSVAPSGALFSASTISPGNSINTASSSLWFGATATGVTICAGKNFALACALGTFTKAGTTTATFTLQTKGAALAYTVAVLDSSGPAPISSIVSVNFVSTGTAAATIAVGATDTVNVVLRLKGSTPKGTYDGWILLTEVATATAVGIPLSLTYQ